MISSWAREQKIKPLRSIQFILLIAIALFTGISCAANDAAPTVAASENRRPASRADGATPLTVPAGGSLQNPAWSPDSGELLLTRFVNGYNAEPADLLTFNLTTGLTRTLVSDGSGNVNLPGSAWNRVTGYIAFSSSRDPHDEIYTIYADGPANDEWRITYQNDRADYEASFSPDGEWIVFESHPLDVEDNGVITTYKLDDSQAYQALTAPGDDCRQPNWSPAGDLILYQKFANGQWDLWTMTPDGGSHRQVTTGSGDKTDASFSSDGKWIVYSSDEGGLDYANLFIIPATGGASTRLTTYNGYDGAPSWSPDGRRIAFESAPGDPDAVGATTLWQIPVPQSFAPRLLFDGGFETGDPTQWESVSWNQNRPLHEQMQIVTDTVRQGKYAAKTTVHDGDEFLDTGGERIQFESPGPYEHEGDDYWYAWSTLFSTGWQPPNDWLLIADWHATYPNICQPLQLELDNANALSVQILTGDVTGYDCFDGPGTALNDSQVIIQQITPGEWNDFIIHVKWTTSNNGLIEIWHKLASDPQFTKVLDWRGIPTLQYKGDPAQPNTPYLILAHYRDINNTHTSVLYHDGFRMALSAADLAEGNLYNLAASVPITWTRTNPGGGGAFNVVGAGPSGVVIVGSDLSGAYRSLDGGQTWDVIGSYRGLTSTHVSGVGFNPVYSHTLYLGTEAGIFRSNNFGATVSQTLASGYITDIEIPAAAPSLGYAAYHPEWNSNNGRVYKTTDNGLSWNRISNNSLPDGRHILKIAAHPTETNTLYLLTGEGRFACGPAEVYESRDGGVNWAQLASDKGQISDFALDKNNPNVLYLTTYGDVWDEGYTCISDDPNGGVLYKGTRSSGNWTWTQLPMPNGLQRNTLLWLDRDDDYALRLIDLDYPELWETTDDGAHWTNPGDKSAWERGWTDTEHAYGTSFNGDALTLGQDLSDSDALWWVDSQFVYATGDDGRSFGNRYTSEAEADKWQSRGVDNIVMFDLAISPANSNDIYLGNFDIGCWRSRNGGQSWSNCNHPASTGNWQGAGGNTTTLAADPERVGVVWTAQSPAWEAPGTLLRSADAGDTWATVGGGLPSAPLMGLSLDVGSPQSNRVMFITAEGDVYRSVDDGANWSKVFDCNGCRFTAVDYFDGNLVYAGGEAGLYRSTNGGDSASWASVGLPEMAGSVSGEIWTEGWAGVFAITPSPHLSQTVYIAALGQGKGLYRSQDAGAHWNKLLNDDFMRDVAVSPQNPNLLLAASSSAFMSGGYASGSQGVLYSSDGGQSWTQVNQGLAWPFANPIAFDPNRPNTVFMGSPGAGFYKGVISAGALLKSVYLPLILKS